MTEPRGVPLRHSKLFNTQAAVSAFELQRDIEAFETANRPDNVVHIVLRSPLGLAEVKTNGGKKVLDEHGRCPSSNLRAAQKAFNNCVQPAIAELERRQVLVPFLVWCRFRVGQTSISTLTWWGNLSRKTA